MVNTQELQKDFSKPKLIQAKLLQYFQQNINNTTPYVYTLTAILRGKYLNEK